MYKKIFLLLSFYWVSLGAMSIDEVIDKALLNNNKLKKVSVEVKEAESFKESLKSKNFGRIDFLASYDYYNKPRTLAPLEPIKMVSGTGAYGVPTTNNMFMGGVAYNVVLFDGFAQRNSYKISDIAHNTSIMKSKLAKEELIYNVRTLYVSVLALKEQYNAQHLYTLSQKKLYKNIEQKYLLGSKSKLDLLKAQNSYQESLSRENVIQANIDILKSTLTMLMGGYPIDKVSKIEFDMESEDDDIAQNNLDTLDRYKIAKLQSDIASKKVKKASALYYPVIDFSAYYGYAFGPNSTTNTYPKTGEKVISENDMNSENIWQLGVHLKWNIYDFGVRSSTVQKEKLALESSRLELNDIRLELQKDIQTAKSKLRLQKANYLSAQTQYRLLQEIVKAQELKYDTDAITIDDLLDSKAKENIAFAQMSGAKYEYLKIKYYMEYLYEKGDKK